MTALAGDLAATFARAFLLAEDLRTLAPNEHALLLRYIAGQLARAEKARRAAVAKLELAGVRRPASESQP